MDLKQLRAFAVAGETLHFTRAAGRLGCTQANVTMQVQQLERELGGRLFERLGKKVVLTPMGASLLPRAHAILGEVKAAKAIAGEVKPTLRIGAAESLCVYRLPDILAEYRRQHPEVQIFLTLLECREYVPSLESGAADVVFALGGPTETPGCRVVAAIRESVSVYARPDHPLTARRRVAARDFEDQPFLLTGEGCGYRAAFLRFLESAGVCARIVMEADSIQALKQAAAVGVGLCVLPDIAVGDELAGGTLARLSYDGMKSRPQTRILCHKGKWLSPALTAFLRVAEQRLGKKRSGNAVSQP